MAIERIWSIKLITPSAALPRYGRCWCGCLPGVRSQAPALASRGVAAWGLGIEAEMAP